MTPLLPLAQLRDYSLERLKAKLLRGNRMPQFLLANHAHLCVSGGHVVILDLRHDKYSYFDLVDASPLSTLVPGWPIFSPQAAAQPISADEAAVQDLLSTELLTRNHAIGKDASPIALQPAAKMILTARSVFDDYSKPRFPISKRQRAAFISAVRRTRSRFKSRTLEQIVDSVVHRRNDIAWTRSGIPTRSPPEAIEKFDWEDLRKHMDCFFWLRPWGYKAKDRCLFDSFTLAEYLAAFGIHPHCVIGVKTNPFAAHCWVQAGDTVLNDSVNNVREYTPIMAA